MSQTAEIRVELPAHLRTLARVSYEVRIVVPRPVTTAAILDAIEAEYPMLQGAIRDHGTLRRRPFIRFFACGLDLSHDPADMDLPAAVANGTEPFIVLGAIAGG
jgi:hypothetical protein